MTTSPGLLYYGVTEGRINCQKIELEIVLKIGFEIKLQIGLKIELEFELKIEFNV